MCIQEAQQHLFGCPGCSAHRKRGQRGHMQKSASAGPSSRAAIWQGGAWLQGSTHCRVVAARWRQLHMCCHPTSSLEGTVGTPKPKSGAASAHSLRPCRECSAEPLPCSEPPEHERLSLKMSAEQGHGGPARFHAQAGTKNTPVRARGAPACLYCTPRCNPHSMSSTKGCEMKSYPWPS